MTQRDDPPTYPGSGRSIYERLGIDPAPRRPLHKPITLPVGPTRLRWVGRYLILLLIGLGLIGIGRLFDVAIGGSGVSASRTRENEYLRGFQARQIAQLELRVARLEAELQALQHADMGPADVNTIRASKGATLSNGTEGRQGNH